MAATIFNLDAANLFTGDDDPGNSQFLTLQSVKLPSLEESTRSHTPGGGIMAIDIGNKKINALMLTFTLVGLNPDVMPKFMAPQRQKYTVRGNLFNASTQEDLPVVGVITGKMVRSEVSQFTKDDGVNTDYEIREVTKYMLTIDGQEKYYFDFFGGIGAARVDGVPMFQAAARNLGLL